MAKQKDKEKELKEKIEDIELVEIRNELLHNEMYKHDPDIWTRKNGDYIATKEDKEIYKRLAKEYNENCKTISSSNKLALQAELKCIQSERQRILKVCKDYCNKCENRTIKDTRKGYYKDNCIIGKSNCIMHDIEQAIKGDKLK